MLQSVAFSSGTGKSHLLIGLGRVIGRYGRIDLLCLDELGYIGLDRRGAELLFQVFTEREEKASVAIASNAAFSEWAATFSDPRLCAAIVGRLTYDAHIIGTGAGSCRLRTATARRQAART
jgi:DNA replication protein DnaC